MKALLLGLGVVVVVGTLAVAASAPARARACSARDLRLARGAMLHGATGTMLGELRFRDVSHGACELGGQPAMQLSLRHALPVRERTTSPAESPVTSVAAGTTVGLMLDWTNWCGGWSGPRGPVQTLDVRIRLTTGTVLSVRVRSGRPRCDARRRPSVLYVARFVAAR